MRLFCDQRTLRIENWVIEDSEIVPFFMDQEPEKREEVFMRALKIGVLSLINSSAAVNVDYVEKEFNKLGQRLKDDFDSRLQKVIKELDGVFSGDEGVLKKSLNEYLGQGGRLAGMFDPDRRDSVISIFSGIMDKHFGDRGSVMQKLLDPTDVSSPFGKFRESLESRLKEMGQTLQALSKELAVKSAQQVAMEKSALKGVVFEDLVLQETERVAAVLGDTVIRVGDQSGDKVNSRKGDLLVELNSETTGGREIKFVVEAKDTKTTIPSILDQLTDAMKNRRAKAAVAVFARADQLPSGVGPFRSYPGNRFIAVLDKENLDGHALQLAYRAARYHADRESLQQTSSVVDSERLHSLIVEASGTLQRISSIKGRLTEGKGLLDGVAQELDKLSGELRSKLLDMDRCIVERPSDSSGVA